MCAEGRKDLWLLKQCVWYLGLALDHEMLAEFIADSKRALSPLCLCFIIKIMIARSTSTLSTISSCSKPRITFQLAITNNETNILLSVPNTSAFFTRSACKGSSTEQGTRAGGKARTEGEYCSENSVF